MKYESQDKLGIKAILTTQIRYTDLCEESHTVEPGYEVTIEEHSFGLTAIIGMDRVEIQRGQYTVLN